MFLRLWEDQGFTDSTTPGLPKVSLLLLIEMSVWNGPFW
jgi:hypothetical protein